MDNENWWGVANPHSKECAEFASAIAESEFRTYIMSLIMEGYKTTYYIRGKLNMVDDGDGYWDDMSGDIEIYYCPFCGKKL